MFSEFLSHGGLTDPDCAEADSICMVHIAGDSVFEHSVAVFSIEVLFGWLPQKKAFSATWHCAAFQMRTLGHSLVSATLLDHLKSQGSSGTSAQGST